MADIKVGRMTLGGFQTNCYYVYRESAKNAAESSTKSEVAESSAKREIGAMCPAIVVDPAEQGEAIFEALKRKGFFVAAILLTHGHVDHIAGVTELRKCSGAKVYACEKEAELLTDMQDNLSMVFGNPLKVHADVLLRDGEEITLADMSFQTISTPGHTIGSCVYYFKEADILLSGDTLFDGSVGRTDFPTGSMSLLVRSIKNKLFVLPEKTICYPGHGGTTTIGWEKDNNPFVV